MNKGIKAGILLVGIGAVLALAGILLNAYMPSGGLDVVIEKQSDASEVKTIQIRGGESDVVIETAADTDVISISYSKEPDMNWIVQMEDGGFLSIQPSIERSILDYIGIQIEPKQRCTLRVVIPQDCRLNALTCDAGTESLHIYGLPQTDSVSLAAQSIIEMNNVEGIGSLFIEMAGGNWMLDNVNVSGDFTAELGSSSGSASGLRAGTLAAKLVWGSLRLTEAEILGDVDLRTEGGALYMENVDVSGNVTANAQAGSVYFYHLTAGGDLRTTMEDGNIDIEACESAGNMTFISGCGDQYLLVNGAASVTAENGSGNVYAGFREGMAVYTESIISENGTINNSMTAAPDGCPVNIRAAGDIEMYFFTEE